MKDVTDGLLVGDKVWLAADFVTDVADGLLVCRLLLRTNLAADKSKNPFTVIARRLGFPVKIDRKNVKTAVGDNLPAFLAISDSIF